MNHNPTVIINRVVGLFAHGLFVQFVSRPLNRNGVECDLAQMFTSLGRWNNVLHVPYLCHRYLHNNFPLFIHMQFFSRLKLCHALFEYKLTRHKSYFIKLKWNNRPGYQQTKITLGFQLFNALKMRSCLILQRNLSQELHTY